MAQLKITLTNLKEHAVHELTEAEVRLGKHPDNEIVIKDGRVSRYHAVVRQVGDSFQIKDLKSLNGTMINGLEIPPDQWKAFQPDDEVILAKGAALLTLDLESDSLSKSVSFSDTPVGEGATVFRSADQIIEQLEVSDATKVIAAGSDAILQEIARLSKHVEKQAERIKLLSKLSQALGSVSTFSLEEIYDRSIDLLFKFTPADRCLILLADPASGDLQPVRTRHRPHRAEIQTIPLSRTITTRVREERQSVLWSKLPDDSQAPGTLVKFGIHSVMCAPLLGRHGLLGVIYVDRQSPTEMFKVDDLELLNTVTGPTAIAIDNALAFEQLRREELTRAAYNRFLPPHLVDKLLAAPDAIQLGGTNQVVTILFSDIRGFTTLAEKADPQKVVGLLNDYFTEMTELVFENNGTLDKYLGDGLMALFGAPESSPDDPINAVRTAVQMQQQMVTLSQELTQYDIPPIGIGIGINTGEVTVGYIGSERRTDYTAIGDAVNLTARLEGKAAKGQILISQATVNRIKDVFPTRPLGPIQVKGKTDLIEVHEVLWEGAQSDREANARKKNTQPLR